MLKIGNLEIMYRAVPAPMASFTDIVYRRLMDEIGCIGFMVTEMISAEGLRRKQVRTLEMLQTFDFKAPQFVQLFGAEPEPITEAARYIENETNYSGIDINMGCPAPKVLRKGAGAGLLKDPVRMAAIVRALKRSISLPVTVKVRLGYDEVNIFDTVEILDREGVDAVTVHFRLKCDRYRGRARWEYAPLLRERIKTVLIGNGDIRTAEEAKEKLGIVEAVMIGRGAVRNPLIFAEIAGAQNREFNLRWCTDRLLQLIEEHYPPKLRLPRFKAFARFLFSGRSGSKKTRTRVYAAKTFEEIRTYLQDMEPGDGVKK